MDHMYSRKHSKVYISCIFLVIFLYIMNMTRSFTIVYCKIVHLDLQVFIQLLYCKSSCFICFFLVFQNPDKSRKRFCRDPFKVATACLTAFCLLPHLTHDPGDHKCSQRYFSFLTYMTKVWTLKHISRFNLI